MNKTLHVTNPYVKHTPESSFLFSIIGDIPTADEWICSELLSMAVRKQNAHDEFSMTCNYFEECPFLHIIGLKNEIALNILRKHFSELIIDGINNEYYISAQVNAKHIKNYHNNKDFIHHIHIYGYDDDNSRVYIADHFENGYFSFETCSFNEINKSRDIINTNIAFVKLKNDARYDLTKEKLNEKINEHVSGENLFYKYNVSVFPDPDSQIEDYYFGIKFYDCLIDILDYGRFPYIRPVVLIFEHVKIIGMLLAIIERKYSANMNELKNKYNKLKEKTEILKNVYIKINMINEFNDGDYNILKDLSQRNALTELIYEIKNRELYIFNMICGTL